MNLASKNSSIEPLRVLFLIDSFRMGGAERVTVALLPYLAGNHIAPYICTLNHRKDSPLIEAIRATGLPLFNLDASRMFDVRAFYRLIGILRREKIQLVHAQLQDSNIFAAAASRVTGIPAITTRHVINDDDSTYRRKLRNKLEKFAVRKAMALTIAVSNATREHYANLAAIPLSRIKTIYNGIELKQFQRVSDKSQLRRNLGLPLEIPLIIMVGVMRPGKGHDIAIEAMRNVKDAHLLLVGDGHPEFRTRLESSIPDLRQRVHLLGQRMDIPDLLNASDILILPSYSEALPTVLIEAGAAGLPAIASDVGGCDEIIQHGNTGMLIPPGDADALSSCILELLGDREKREAMGLSARLFINSRFSLRRQADELMSTYEDIVASASSA